MLTKDNILNNHASVEILYFLINVHKDQDYFQQFEKYYNDLCSKTSQNILLIGFNVIDPNFKEILEQNIVPKDSKISKNTSIIYGVLSSYEYILKNIKGYSKIILLTEDLDLDTIGGMAIITMALNGGSECIKKLTPERIYSICYNNNDNFNIKKALTYPIGPLVVATRNSHINIRDRVNIMIDYLKDGIIPKEYIQTYKEYMSAIKINIDDYNIAQINYKKNNKLGIEIQLGYMLSDIIVLYTNIGTNLYKYRIYQKNGTEYFDPEDLVYIFNQLDVNVVKDTNKWQWNISKNFIKSPPSGSEIEPPQISFTIYNNLSTQIKPSGNNINNVQEIDSFLIKLY